MILWHYFYLSCFLLVLTEAYYISEMLGNIRWRTGYRWSQTKTELIYLGHVKIYPFSHFTSALLRPEESFTLFLQTFLINSLETCSKQRRGACALPTNHIFPAILSSVGRMLSRDTGRVLCCSLKLRRFFVVIWFLVACNFGNKRNIGTKVMFNRNGTIIMNSRTDDEILWKMHN